MANGLKAWFGGMALGCVAIAVAYLPARGMGAFPDFMGGGFRRYQEPKEREITGRRKMLAERYKIVNSQIEALRLRQEAEPILEAHRAAGEAARAAVFGADSTMAERQRVMIPGFDSAWRQLGLDDAKIAIVLASPGRKAPKGDTPGTSNWWKTYILPDSTDRTTCVIIYPTAVVGDERPRQAVIEQRMRIGLGPCAFYARFGAPSPRVWRWLAANQFDVAENADWSDLKRFRDSRFEDDSWREFIGVGSIWYYTSLYGLSFNTVACLAGRVPACLEGVRRGDREDGTPMRRVFTPGEYWRENEQRLPEQSSLLATIVHEVGEDAFQQFWTTSLPVDSALSIALNQPVGEWLASRQIRDRDTIQLGPIPPWPTLVVPSLIAALFLALAAYAVTFRQVR